MNNVRMVRGKFVIQSELPFKHGLYLRLDKVSCNLNEEEVDSLLALLIKYKKITADSVPPTPHPTPASLPPIVESEDLERGLVENLPPSTQLGEMRYLVVADFKPEDTGSQPYLVVQWFGRQMGWKFVGYGPY